MWSTMFVFALFFCHLCTSLLSWICGVSSTTRTFHGYIEKNISIKSGVRHKWPIRKKFKRKIKRIWIRLSLCLWTCPVKEKGAFLLSLMYHFQQLNENGLLLCVIFSLFTLAPNKREPLTLLCGFLQFAFLFYSLFAKLLS